ncbi:hypothetical protein SD81_036925 [Tolypothrix campylonemoides VB511288]|nr:hypothetical protein SD81_036925 [Tolypothrix campylonemoides VB511288]
MRSPPALFLAESPFLCFQDTLRQECDRALRGSLQEHREATPKEYHPYTTKGLPEEQPLLCLYKETEQVGRASYNHEEQRRRRIATSN